MSPLEVIARQLDSSTISSLGQRVGATPQQTQSAVAGISETLLGAMARNVQRNPQQAQQIERALDRDNHSALLGNLGSLLGGGGGMPQGVSSRSTNGMGILRHILGNKTGRVADQVSKSSGLNAGQVGQLMVMLAPVVMGALGQSRQQAPQQQGGIASILGSVLGGGGGPMGGGMPQARQQPSSTRDRFLNAVLDRNGDGNSTDDLASMGMDLLGGLFGGRR